MLTPLLAAVQVASWIAVPVAPRVGDTVFISRVVEAPPRATVRTEALTASDDLIPLTAPQVIPRADGAVVRHVVALFRTGPVTVRMPAVLLVHPDRGAETLPEDSVVIEVASVLPTLADPDTLALRGSASPLAQPMRRLARFVVPVLAVLVLIAVSLGWRRRPRRAPAPAPEVPEPFAPPTGRWIASGEARVAAAWGLQHLRQAVKDDLPVAHDALDLAAWRAVVGEHRPEWPLRRLDELLDRLERARFAPLGTVDVEELLVEVEELVDAWTRGPGDMGDMGDVGDVVDVGDRE